MRLADYSPIIVRETIRDIIDEKLYDETDLSHMKVIMPVAHKFAESFSICRSIENCIFDYFERILI